jgi:polar amino acid transport system substrate-binding protein
MLVVLLVTPACCFAVSFPRDLRIITEEYAPLNYMENGTLQGISVEVVEQILQRMETGMNRSSFEVMPWHEGYNLTLNRPDTILFSINRYPEREDLFLWAGPVIHNQKVIFELSGKNQVIDATIARMKIVAIKNDSGVQLAIHAGANPKNIIEVLSAMDAVKMVENGSVHGWVYGKIAGLRAINQFADDPTVFMVGRELGENKEYIAFNQKTSPEFVLAFNETLQTLKRDRTENGVTTYEQIVSRYLPAQCANTPVSRDKIISLVSDTVSGIKKDAKGTMAAINTGEHPYRDVAYNDLNIYVYDTGVHLMANSANPGLVGKNFSGTMDIYGKPFRDELVSEALKNGTGWVSYVYSNPDSLGLNKKMSYFQLVTGSDGKEYVVGAGVYVPCGDIS